jgi:glycopeptide antibiotics resistance protein
VGFTIAQLAPLDLTLDLGELAAKYRAGRVVLIPFSYEYASWTAMAWDHLWDVLVNVPLGAAALLLGTPAGGRRTAGAALALAVFGVAAIEFGQVLVGSRVADVTDVLKGSLGAALGVAVASRAVQAAPAFAPGALDRIVVLARLGLATWAIALIGYHWNPFQFSFDRERVLLGLRQISELPLTHHFWSQEFHAFTEMLRKAMLALPLGALLYISWPDRGQRYVPRLRALLAMAGGFALLLVIELGQVFLPSRLPDITDVILGTAGILVGLWLAGRMARTRAPQSR